MTCESTKFFEHPRDVKKRLFCLNKPSFETIDMGTPLNVNHGFLAPYEAKVHVETPLRG
jgi:hypothetical protein